MKRWREVAGAVGLAIVVLAALGAVVVLRGGISARVEPGRLEASVARAVRNWSIPASARDAANPVPASPRAVAAGLAHFADHCASCHGNDGSGNTPLGRNLYPRAPDMRRATTQELTDGELFYIIENGVRLTGMPAWGGAGTAEGSWQLVHFVRHLPKLGEEERARMEALNPRSPDEWRALEDERTFLSGEEPPSRGSDHGAHAH